MENIYGNITFFRFNFAYKICNSDFLYVLSKQQIIRCMPSLKLTPKTEKQPPSPWGKVISAFRKFMISV